MLYSAGFARAQTTLKFFLNPSITTPLLEELLLLVCVKMRKKLSISAMAFSITLVVLAILASYD